MAIVEGKIQRRTYSEDVYAKALLLGLSPLQARILAARVDESEVNIENIISPSLRLIPPPKQLVDADRSAGRIADAIANDELIGILTDYDVDGVCSHVVIYESLVNYFGVSPSRIQSHIGHRIEDGYGISRNLVDRIRAQKERPTLVITADCGSSDEVGVNSLSAFSDVVITDHHIVPTEGPPSSAFAVVNPSRDDCLYPDRTIAGCMVAWLLMSHVRKILIERSSLSSGTPKLSALLDVVALGTVADCVSIATGINRAVVKSGLDIMNRMSRPCWQAAKRRVNVDQFDEQDLAFQIGPRINARSRMADPYAALHFLLSRDSREAEHWLDVLDSDNKSRRETERSMVRDAIDIAARDLSESVTGLSLYLEDGHAGVQGIVASRILDRFGHPVVVFSDGTEDGYLQGSGRSVPQVHLREALEYVDKQVPGCIKKFGGHRAAAGVTIRRDLFSAFRAVFSDAVKIQVAEGSLQPVILTDGELDDADISIATIKSLKSLSPFGREFEVPTFQNDFVVKDIRMVGTPAIHASCRLGFEERELKAIWFNAVESEHIAYPVGVGDRIQCAYQLAIDNYNGNESIQLLVRHAVSIN